MAIVVETRLTRSAPISAVPLETPALQTTELETPTLPPFADVALDHVDRLYAFCIRLTNHPSDAEDLVQETLRCPGRTRR